MVLFCGSGPSGELSWWGIDLGIVVLVGNGWALFLSGGELSSWGVVLEPVEGIQYLKKTCRDYILLFTFMHIQPVVERYKARLEY